jgi:hypothetical protein
MCLRVSYKKYEEKKYFFCILKVTEERSRIQSWNRIRICTKMSRISNTVANFCFSRFLENFLAVPCSSSAVVFDNATSQSASQYPRAQDFFNASFHLPA